MDLINRFSSGAITSPGSGGNSTSHTGSSDKDGAGRWEVFPSCSEAINLSFTLALRLPRAAHVCPGERPASLAPSLDTPASKVAMGQMAVRDPGCHAPLPGRKREDREEAK